MTVEKKIEEVEKQLRILKRESMNGYCNLDAQQEISYLETKLRSLMSRVSKGGKQL